MRSIKSLDQREAPIVYFDVQLDDMNLTVYEYRAYGRIARRASGGQRACTESLEAMARGCQMSRPTLVRAIRGLISRRMIARDSKLGDTSTYYLTDKSEWLGKPEIHLGGQSEIQGVDQTFTRGGKPEIQGVVNQRSTKNTREEDKKKTREETPATSSPVASKTTIDDLGEILEDTYPGHATNWNTMRELRDLVNRVHGTRSDVLAFPEWLRRNYPKKANSPFAFKDLFPEMVKEIRSTKQPSTPSHCGECNNGWILIDDTARRCQCQKALATA
jgi:hypothetical protein